MSLESVDYIDDLVITNPVAGDPKSEGDDHLRNIKKAIKATFPNIDGAMTATQAELNILDGVTATTAELNILDGVTATTSEINHLDGITASVDELNILDGVTSTAAELNTLDGITATTAELNLLEGRTGTVWTSTNDGSGSGLDADKLDGLHTAAASTAGPAANHIPYISTSGVMEVGRYLDFHHAVGNGDDYNVRLSTDGSTDGELFIDSTKKIWHSGNDGTGSGLAADTAAKLATARTISLSGDVSGSTSFDGSATATIDATVANNSHSHDSSTVSSCSGNANTATKLQTARTISLSGDVSGSTSFDGSANATITAAVANNSHSHTASTLTMSVNDLSDAKTTSSSVHIGATPTSTSGYSNTSVGISSCESITEGDYNSAVGYNALSDVTTGSYNTALGFEAAGYADANMTNCTAIGYSSLRVVTGTRNTAVGSGTGSGMTSGAGNTYVGYVAGHKDTTGGFNTGVGHYAGYDITTGSFNVCLGHYAGRLASPSGEITTQSNIVCLGDNDVTALYCADTTISSSDKRDKADVEDFEIGLEFVKKLNPVTYRWDRRTWYGTEEEPFGVPDGSKKADKLNVGLLAQDLEEVEEEYGVKNLISNWNEDGTAIGIKYDRLVPALINAVKELSAKVEELEAQLNG